MKDSECVTRGVLPHWYKPGYAHFITYRLADSIPAVRLRQWRAERQKRIDQPIPGDSTPAGHRERAHKLFYRRYDEYLDSHVNLCWLAQDSVFDVVRKNVYHHHGNLYELLAWCVMPNHVHIVIQPLENGMTRSTDAGSVSNEVTDAACVSNVEDAASILDHVEPLVSDEIADDTSVLSRIMHSLKSYTANRANTILDRNGRFWQRESYDHWIRDIDELERIVAYVNANPVKAGLCDQPHDWRYSSAYDRYQRDGSTCGLVGWLRDDWRS